MIAWLRRFAGDERGGTLALIAVMIAGLLAVGALVIDLGLLFTARAEAQRAADSAALAAASAFLDVTPIAAAVGPATDRAIQFATLNAVRNVNIVPEEVEVEVDTGNSEVWVRVTRTGLPLFFARLLGRDLGTVAASAVAAARQANSAKCLKPLAIPDYWQTTVDDLNGNRVWDENERWRFDPSRGDFYIKFDGDNYGTATGYGSGWRDLTAPGYTADIGRPLTIKPQNPQQAVTAGFFFPIRIGDSQGAQDYRNNMTGCNPTEVLLGEDVRLEMGNMVGPTRQAINQILAEDPGAYWDESTARIVNSQFANPLDSPRVLLLALFDPALIEQIHGQASGGGQPSLQFNDFGLFFLEGMDQQGGNNAPVRGRFMYYATGTGVPLGDEAAGALVRVLQLVR